jgi:hypothetical protein
VKLTRLAAFTVAFVLCGGLGTIAVLLTAALLHGLAQTVVGITVGATVCLTCGYLLDRHTSKEHHQ